MNIKIARFLADLQHLLNSRQSWATCRIPKRCAKCEADIPKGARFHLLQGQRKGKWKTITTCCNCKPEPIEHAV